MEKILLLKNLALKILVLKMIYHEKLVSIRVFSIIAKNI